MIARRKVLFGLLLVAAAATPARAQYAEDTPGLGLRLGPVDMSLHGYFRAPFRFSWRNRGEGLRDGELLYNIHSPWLVDDDYFRSGFAYTRIQEQDWSELFFSVGNKHLTGTIGLMGSLFSDWAKPLLDKQLGIAQGFLTFRWEWEGPKWKFKLQMKGGSFWDRFGWLEAYDTYIFGRTHQLGAQIRGDLEYGKLKATLLYGFGAHLEAIEVNQGLTLLNYFNLSASWDGLLGAGFYVLDGATQDRRQLKEIADADMNVAGADAWVRHPLVGRIYIAGSRINASQSEYLGPAIEVMHSYGGRGLQENFLGTERSEHGTGALSNFAFEWGWSLKEMMTKYAPEKTGFLAKARDLQLRLFGLYTKVESKQADPDPAVNRDNRGYFKWGIEPTVRAFSWLSVSLRYDRVILNLADNESAFRVLSPKIAFHVNWWVQGQIFFIYSHYWYGERVLLRPGQVALETLPDGDVFKVQAQLVF